MYQIYCSEKDIYKILGNQKFETCDCVEGCLVDSFVIQTENITIFAFGHCLNSWSSDLETYFVDNNDKDNINKLWIEFEKIKSEEEE